MRRPTGSPCRSPPVLDRIRRLARLGATLRVSTRCPRACDPAGQRPVHALVQSTMRLLLAAGAYGSPALATTLRVSAAVLRSRAKHDALASRCRRLRLAGPGGDPAGQRHRPTLSCKARCARFTPPAPTARRPLQGLEISENLLAWTENPTRLIAVVRCRALMERGASPKCNASSTSLSRSAPRRTPSIVSAGRAAAAARSAPARPS
jgi:hypothetical protein